MPRLESTTSTLVVVVVVLLQSCPPNTVHVMHDVVKSIVLYSL